MSINYVVNLRGGEGLNYDVNWQGKRVNFVMKGGKMTDVLIINKDESFVEADSLFKDFFLFAFKTAKLTKKQ